MKFRQPHIELLIKELLLFVLFCFCFALLGSVIVLLLNNAFGIEGMASLAASLSEKTEPDARNIVRIMLMVSHLFMFALPCVAYAIWRYRSQTLSGLNLNKTPHPNNILYSVAIILVSLPFVMLTMWLNQQIPLSESMIEMEQKAAEMTKNLLVMDSSFELIITLIAVAVTPAIGEELMFRGILQPVFEKLFKNGHIAVWVTAILFSAIHFQMQGFIPRMILGAFLGYFYLYTRNLWIPIFAHFVFNGSQVIAKYTTSIEVENPEVNINEVIVPGLISMGLLFLLGYLFWKFNQDNQPLTTNESKTIHE